MNYLQLCQRVAMECGVNLRTGDVPSTVSISTGSAGELRSIVEWTSDAYVEIQNRHRDWDWMRTSTSWVSVDGQSAYTLVNCGLTAATFGMWAVKTFRNYPTATGNTAEIFMSVTDYDLWRDTYLYGGTRAARSRPTEFAIGPDKSVNVGPVPAAGYTFTADYFTAPVVLANDDDEPALPSHYHMAIVWAACMRYGEFNAASEVYQRAANRYAQLMRQMESDRLPQMALGGPLA